MVTTDEQLVRAFYTAALYLIDKVEREGWYWTSNFLREYVRATTGLRFTNSRSPYILRLLGRKFPELEWWIKLKPLTRLDRSDPAAVRRFQQVEKMIRDAQSGAQKNLF
jgi:hypothetical protein